MDNNKSQTPLAGGSFTDTLKDATGIEQVWSIFVIGAVLAPVVLPIIGLYFGALGLGYIIDRYTDYNPHP